MSGNNVGRKRNWPWVVLSALFALAFVWSFAGAGGVWSILRIGSAIGLGACLLRLILLSVSSRRLRRAQDEGGRAEGEGPSSEDQSPAPEDDQLPADEWAEIEPEGQPSAEEPPTEEPVPTSEADVQALDVDIDEDVDRDETLDADAGSEDHLRRIREEFRARAEEAALRVKQREAELQEAASVADQER